MKIIRTHEVDPASYTEFEREMVYNGLDCCVTRDVFDALHPQLNNLTAATYDLSKALQAPTIEMRCRGILIDQARKSEVIDEYFEIVDHLERNLDRIVLDGVGMATFNWRSNRDLQRLLYDELGLPPIRKSGRLTTDRSARERLEVYPAAQQIIKHINIITEIADKISVLKTVIDPDGRIRTSYNIAGTSTGRFSSSATEFGTGGNLQNVEESLRSIFIADPGYKFAKCDAKSGESYCVGAVEWNLFHDGRYLDAIETGDIHTAVARFTWPNLPWNGEKEHDRALADEKFYRHLTRRDVCKKLGHGSSYGGKPNTLAEQSRIPVDLVTEFQKKFFSTFPAHQQWQAWVDSQLRKKGYLVSLMGRQRWFFGRRNDPATLREAIAYDPQSSLRDIVSHAMLRIWRKGYVQIVADVHDALIFQYPEKDEEKILPMLLEDLVIDVPLAHGRVLRIPYDAQTGWNQGKYSPNKNPNGMKDWQGYDNRKREKEAGILDRIVHRTNRKPQFPRNIS